MFSLLPLFPFSPTLHLICGRFRLSAPESEGERSIYLLSQGSTHFTQITLRVFCASLPPAPEKASSLSFPFLSIVLLFNFLHLHVPCDTFSEGYATSSLFGCTFTARCATSFLFRASSPCTDLHFQEVLGSSPRLFTSKVLGSFSWLFTSEVLGFFHWLFLTPRNVVATLTWPAFPYFLSSSWVIHFHSHRKVETEDQCYLLHSFFGEAL